MRKLLVAVLALAWTIGITGCSGGGPTPSEKDFQKLYREYSARFHEKMVTGAEMLPPIQITAEAARIWDEVFATHKDVLKKRCQEVLSDLDKGTVPQEDLYIEIASGSREAPAAPAAETEKGIVLKQFVWNPMGAAQMGLDNWLRRLLQPNSYNVRTLLTANANLTWEAVDPNVETPKLLLRQGPMIFIVDLSRKDDYYQVDKIRWLRPKSMGPIAAPPATGTPETTPAPGTPPAPPVAPPATPAAPPAAK